MGYEHDDDREYETSGFEASEIVGVTGALIVLVCVLAAGAWLVPQLLSARKSGGTESAAIGSLKTIAYAETYFREADCDRDEVLAYTGSLAVLASHSLVDNALANGTNQGYEFTLSVGPDPRFEWWAKASPTVVGTTGDRFFYVDYTGLIYFSDRDFEVPIDPENIPDGITVLGS